MTTRATAPKPNLLPALLGLIVACLLGAAALTLLGRTAAPVGAPPEQLSLVFERVPFEAQNALRGDASAFDALAKSMERLKALTAGRAGGQVKLEPDLSKFRAAVGDVAGARAAVETVQAANQETRELAPKLLSELGESFSYVHGGASLFTQTRAAAENPIAGGNQLRPGN